MHYVIVKTVVFISDGNNDIVFDIRDGLHQNCDGIQASMFDIMDIIKVMMSHYLFSPYFKKIFVYICSATFKNCICIANLI